MSPSISALSIRVLTCEINPRPPCPRRPAIIRPPVRPCRPPAVTILTGEMCDWLLVDLLSSITTLSAFIAESKPVSHCAHRVCAFNCPIGLGLSSCIHSGFCGTLLFVKLQYLFLSTNLFLRPYLPFTLKNHLQGYLLVQINFKGKFVASCIQVNVIID